MARFRGTVQGQGGDASRLGSAKSGLTVKANGWKVGVSVYAHEGTDGGDLFEVCLSRGSGGPDISTIGLVVMGPNGPEFRLAESRKRELIDGLRGSALLDEVSNG